MAGGGPGGRLRLVFVFSRSLRRRSRVFREAGGRCHNKLRPLPASYHTVRRRNHAVHVSIAGSEMGMLATATSSRSSRSGLGKIAQDERGNQQSAVW